MKAVFNQGRIGDQQSIKDVLKNSTKLENIA